MRWLLPLLLCRRSWLRTLVDCHFSYLRRPQDHEQHCLLFPDITEALLDSCRERNRVPLPEDRFILSLVTPDKRTGAREHHKHFRRGVAVQWCAFPRADLVHAHEKPVLTRNRRDGFSRAPNQSIALRAVGLVVFDETGVVNGLEILKTCNTLGHLFT